MPSFFTFLRRLGKCRLVDLFRTRKIEFTFNLGEFVPADKITEYVKWGVTGNFMFGDAIEIWKNNRKEEIPKI